MFAANESTDTSLYGNIIWTKSSFALRVEMDSQNGWYSDYNNYFAEGGVGVVWWQKSFYDMLDWQLESGFDETSIGYTEVNPDLDNPAFINLDDSAPENDDYRLQDAASTSIDAGPPDSTCNKEPSPNGGRINLGAYGGTASAALSDPAYIALFLSQLLRRLADDPGQGHCMALV